MHASAHTIALSNVWTCAFARAHTHTHTCGHARMHTLVHSHEHTSMRDAYIEHEHLFIHTYTETSLCSTDPSIDRRTDGRYGVCTREHIYRLKHLCQHTNMEVRSKNFKVRNKKLEVRDTE